MPAFLIHKNILSIHSTMNSIQKFQVPTFSTMYHLIPSDFIFILLPMSLDQQELTFPGNRRYPPKLRFILLGSTTSIVYSLSNETALGLLNANEISFVAPLLVIV